MKKIITLTIYTILSTALWASHDYETSIIFLILITLPVFVTLDYTFSGWIIKSYSETVERFWFLRNYWFINPVISTGNVLIMRQLGVISEQVPGAEIFLLGLTGLLIILIELLFVCTKKTKIKDHEIGI